MRILEICNHFPPTIGGSETHNFSVVKYLYEQGHDVEVIAVRNLQGIEKSGYNGQMKDQILSAEFFHPELLEVHIHNITLKEHKFPYSYLCYFNIWRKVRQIEKEKGRFDLIEVHFLPFSLFFSGKRKIVLTIHSFVVACAKYPNPHQCRRPNVGRCKCVDLVRYINWRLVGTICIHKIDKIIVKYSYMAKKLIEKKLPKSKIAIVPHWIEYEKFQSKGQKNQIQNGDFNVFTFGFLGRLDIREYKGIDLIIEAFKILSNRRTNARMFLIGDGPSRKELEDFCKNNGFLDRVKFVGRVPHDQVSSYFSSVDAFVVGSHYDNYNWALLELMCSGKPIIATNTGGTCDILIDGYNGILADPTPESIAEKMEYVLENYDSLKQIPENALKTIKGKHSLDNLKLYESLLMEIAKK
ncbi:MAG: glycosyltransferase family 4 protein [Candidatus Poribacteria bacterium]